MARFGDCSKFPLQIRKTTMTFKTARVRPPREARDVTDADRVLVGDWIDSLPDDAFNDDDPLPRGELLQTAAEKMGPLSASDIFALESALRLVMHERMMVAMTQCIKPRQA